MEKKEISAPEESVSIRNLIIVIRDWTRYFWSKKYWIILVAGVSALLGLLYAIKRKPVYTATTSFVLESGANKGGLGAYAGIAASFGIDLGGGGSNLFEGENILELYRSRNMISKALLTQYKFREKQQLLIDRYIEYNKLRETWAKKPDLNTIKFNRDNYYDNNKLQLLHDSIMGQVVKTVTKNFLSVAKKDKKLNIIVVAVESEDEQFAKALNETLVQNVNQFYLETKTKKNLENVVILQAKTDSVRAIMTGAIYRAASVSDATPNQNPTRMTQRVAPMQNASVNAEVNQLVLGTLLQNLELSKISLQKDTPLIQIVDQPIFPLEKQGFGKLKGILIGGCIGGIFILIALFIRRTIKLNLPDGKN